MTKQEMLDTFGKAVNTVTAQIEEAKKTELILEGKRQAFQESYDWIKTNIPEDAPAAEAEAAGEAVKEEKAAAPVKEKKSK